jgi:hypothetical protein
MITCSASRQQFVPIMLLWCAWVLLNYRRPISTTLLCFKLQFYCCTGMITRSNMRSQIRTCPSFPFPAFLPDVCFFSSPIALLTNRLPTPLSCYCHQSHNLTAHSKSTSYYVIALILTPFHIAPYLPASSAHRSCSLLAITSSPTFLPALSVHLLRLTPAVPT